MLKNLLIGLALLSAASSAYAGRVGHGTQLPDIPSQNFTPSTYLGTSANNGPYTYMLPNTHIVGTCAGTAGATCAVDVSQYVYNGQYPGTGSQGNLDRVIQTDAGGFFQGHINNGGVLGSAAAQAPGTVLTITVAVTGAALAAGQSLYTGPLPGTKIVSGSGNTWQVNLPQHAGGSSGILVIMMTNGLGKCFNGYIDDGAGGIGTQLTIGNSGTCTQDFSGTATPIAIGQTISGGDNNITWIAGLENQGAFRFLCTDSHLAYDDPVLYPSQPGASHLHDFFGNTLTNSYSTYESLRSTGGGTCVGGPLNRTGYWFPALIDPNGLSGAGAVVRPDMIELYYKGDRTQQTFGQYVPGSFKAKSPVIQLPRGLRYISGTNPADGTSNTTHFWSCTDGSDTAAPGYTAANDLPTLWGYLVAVGKTTSACQQIFARMDAPHCWNGQLRGSTGFNNVSGGQQDGFGNIVCPTTFPISIPSVTFIITFNRGTQDISQWYLSSDCMHGMPLATCGALGHLMYTGGASFHSDWFGGWDVPTMDTWQTHCIQVGSTLPGGYIATPLDTQNSSGGAVCDGTELSSAGGTTTDGYVSPPVITTPSIFPAKEVPIPPMQ